MRYFWIMILILSGVAYAGSEVLDPSGNRTNEWTNGGTCVGAHFSCVSDDDDGTFVTTHSDTDNGKTESYDFDNPTTTDSTILNIVYTLRWRVTHTNNTVAVVDSLSGNGRTSSTIATATTGAWMDSTITYTTAPDGGALTWAKIANMTAGYILVNNQKNQDTDVSEFYMTVNYEYAVSETPWLDRVQSIDGSGLIQDVSDTTKIGHP